jgi:anti-sigma regulatory factor (Ser/Thr protein kinase)
MRRELELTRDVHAPRVARGALARWYRGRLDDEELEAAKVIVTELMSNAVVHGVGRVLLASVLDEDRLLIEVVDEGSGFAHTVPEVRFDALSGRGLAIVDATSSRWGIHEGTTHVWAEIERKTRRPTPEGDASESA